MEQFIDGGPAFPGPDQEQGMTLRQYAAIKLRVPESGDQWLDDMIRKAQRDELATKALPAVYRDLWDDVRAGRHGCVPEEWKMGVALDAYALADAMLAAREGKS
ncbi:hypothetical protein [Cupriavidus gilardii]|uniref:hypothetical protein n=1 Tax=Cupriavidus gilardii TaxID=82541 RepID=UPI0021B15E5F|nr:hypothetical protein [Cupriavidus gilardii]UXC37154.1 hypothetical protein N4G38_06830 [Cupriavidus gilardii]